MSGAKRILLVSRDAMVLQTRKLMLGAYFEVHVAGRVIEANKLLGERRFDLIVLCYTLTDDDCEKIIDSARDCCSRAKFLVLTSTGYAAKQVSIGPNYLSAEEGPFVLVKKAAELLGYEFRSKGRMVRVPPPDLVAAPSGA
jgi:hypothetical protein